MRLPIATLLLLLFSLGAAVRGQNLKPPTPYVDNGACPYECCTYHHSGEGIYKIWFRGKIYQEEMPTAPDQVSRKPPAQREESVQVISEPDAV